ncbi:N-acetyllactosaminide alpha-1,3-galactosyltransferase isoform X1 [Pelobates cultripes]|uniref:N-acetyllactosaminide alpha-1,3-galactosyltransferase isoform X1 n=1 Tax=Pelobates cultripes TaxID=61616 RepID=A0AAD1SZ14_PELCU|nr:N-acetyllactosaminide alpha-1,3-galactosyltransferase isoform X1 [Pelobates cultripes]
MVNMSRLRKICFYIFLLTLCSVIYWKSLICFPGEPSVTPWGAPIVWEGTFNSKEVDRLHYQRGTVVGISVFAVGKYLSKYLIPFLISANRYFMPGLEGVLYVVTDSPSSVPAVSLRPGMTLVILKCPARPRWQDISMMRMKDLQDLVFPLARDQVDYLFCMDVDQVFVSRYGSEALGDLVAQLHSGYYLQRKEDYPYEQDPRSTAFIPLEKVQYYYHASVFGGTIPRLMNLTSSCLRGILEDREKEVEAVWHDESHLNRYLALEDLPSKVLSPEYCWDRRLWLKSPKMRWATKDYENMRE